MVAAGTRERSKTWQPGWTLNDRGMVDRVVWKDDAGGSCGGMELQRMAKNGKHDTRGWIAACMTFHPFSLYC